MRILNTSKVLAVTALLLPFQAMAVKNFYVNCTSGNDAANGLTTGTAVKTLAKARDKVRALQVGGNFNDDIVVNLAVGTCRISSTLKFDQSADGGTGTRTVIYRGQDAANRTVVSGGEAYSTWTKTTVGSVTTASATIGAGRKFRSLYVNDKKAIRARTSDTIPSSLTVLDPSTANSLNATGLRVNSPLLAPLAGATNVELVWNYEWKNTRLMATSIQLQSGTASTYIITMKNPEFQNALQIQGGMLLAPFYVKGFYATGHESLRNASTEWAYDAVSGVLKYVPNGDDTYRKTMTAVVPRLATLIELSNATVKNLRFENIEFSHSDWQNSVGVAVYNLQAEAMVNLANTSNGGDAANISISPAAFTINGSSAVSVTNCFFRHIGNSAFRVGAGASNITLEGNYFNDVGSAAVSIGPTAFTNENTLPKDIQIRNNLIYDVGNEFHGSPAINVYYGIRVNIIHNEISKVPYTGISIGWGWSNAQPYVAQDIISGNRIFDFNNLLWDGGGIYTLGNLGDNARRTVIEKNYIYDDNNITLRFNRADPLPPAPFPNFTTGGAIYLDEGSSFIDVTGNIIEGYKGDDVNWFYIWAGPNVGTVSTGLILSTTVSNNSTSSSRFLNHMGSLWNTVNPIDDIATTVSQQAHWSASVQADVLASGLQNGFLTLRKNFPVAYKLKAKRHRLITLLTKVRK